MVKRWLISLILISLLAAHGGCRAPAPAPAPAAPTLPTSASVGGANIVAIAPPGQQCCPKQTLPQFLGLTGLCGHLQELVDRLRNRLGSIWPGLEAKPEILALADPANLESANPAVAAAAGVKAEEDAAAQKAKAIAYLASVGCAGCYPGIEEALLAALDDCTELVRFETAKALRSTAHMPCKNCCRSACCGPKIREKLTKLAYETDLQGCYLESSDRVRRMARLALANCTCVPDKPGPAEQRLPEEGPSAEDIPATSPEAAPAAAVASILHSPRNSTVPVGSGAIAVPSPTQLASNAVRPVSYEEALAAYSRGRATATPGAVECAWEIWSARPGNFASRSEAVSMMTVARTQIMSSQPGHILPPQLARSVRDWADPTVAGSPALARAIAALPVGGVSGAIEDPSGWHVVRVLGRRPAAPTPAAPAVQAGVSPAGPRITTTRLPDCDCK